eukprot:4694029-Heterocapsa_arctica.AAC.1
MFKRNNFNTYSQFGMCANIALNCPRPYLDTLCPSKVTCYFQVKYEAVAVVVVLLFLSLLMNTSASGFLVNGVGYAG